MAEVTLERVEVWEVTEVHYFGRKVVRGVFSTEAEAWARYQELARREPALVQMGALAVEGRSLEVPRETSTFVEKSEPPSEKMRRAGRDYEDKAGPAYTQSRAGRDSR